MDTFPYKDRGLENDFPPHRSQWRLRRTGVIWSRRRAPELQHSGLIEAVPPGCQLFLPAERFNSPTDNV